MAIDVPDFSKDVKHVKSRVRYDHSTNVQRKVIPGDGREVLYRFR